MSGRALLSVEADMASIRRSLGDLRSESRAVSDAIAGDFRRIDEAGAKAYRKIRREAGRAAEALTAAERAASDAAEAGARRREQIATVEGSYRANAYRGAAEHVERDERRHTNTADRESRRRIAIARREVAERRAILRELASVTVGAVGAGVSAAGQAVLSERQNAARRESDLNTALIQTVPGGASESELAASRSYVMQRISDRRMNADTAIEALGLAQSSAAALNGATPEARRAAIDATLNDVQFANRVNPNNINGIVRFGAIMRNQIHDPAMQQMLMRSAAGIGFAGSVETDEALRSGLPGLMREISTNTANLRPGQNRDEVVRDTVTDFLAQVQTVAASGGTVRLTSNREGTLRTRLSNADTQNRLGQAFANRLRSGAMTPEQQAAFEQAFTRGRDGRYTMNADLVNSPSNASRFFGQQFGNDATAVANFLGPNGGGGARQLINRPEVGLLTSYFATTTNSRGENVRQYDAVNELKRATITDSQMQTITRVRDSEDAANLNAEANARAAGLGDRSNWFVRASHAAQGWAARNPLMAAAAQGVGAGALWKLGRGAFGLARGAIGSATGVAGGAGAGTTLGTLLGGLGLVAGTGANLGAALTGTSASGRTLGPLERLARGGAAALAPMGAALGPAGAVLGTVGAAAGMGDLASRGGASAAHALQAAFSNEQVQMLAMALARAVAGAVKPSTHDRVLNGGRAATENNRAAP